MGACHVCDLSDIWIDTLFFTIYRDDGLDILMNGEEEIRIMKEHMNNLHPNLSWTMEFGKEGGYLDLWLMVENDKIEWKSLSYF